MKLQLDLSNHEAKADLKATKESIHLLKNRYGWLEN